jgi:hypothetical protein
VSATESGVSSRPNHSCVNREEGSTEADAAGASSAQARPEQSVAVATSVAAARRPTSEERERDAVRMGAIIAALMPLVRSRTPPGIARPPAIAAGSRLSKDEHRRKPNAGRAV